MVVYWPCVRMTNDAHMHALICSPSYRHGQKKSHGRSLERGQVLTLLVGLRVLGAIVNCIADCDETYN